MLVTLSLTLEQYIDVDDLWNNSLQELVDMADATVDSIDFES